MTARTRVLGFRRVVLFEREGASMASSWTDVIALTKRKNETFTLRIATSWFVGKHWRR